MFQFFDTRWFLY